MIDHTIVIRLVSQSRERPQDDRKPASIRPYHHMPKKASRQESDVIGTPSVRSATLCWFSLSQWEYGTRHVLHRIPAMPSGLWQKSPFLRHARHPSSIFPFFTRTLPS